MKDYVYLYPNVSIKAYKNTTYEIFYLILEEKEKKNYKQDDKIYQINNIGKDILLLLDGTLTYHEIIEHFMRQYNESEDAVDRKVSDFILQLGNIGISLCEQDCPQRHNITYLEFDNYYPTVASLELANICNIRCRHCYGDFGEKDNSYILGLENIKKIISSLAEIGLSILELTGGDPTMNPHCADAIEIALDSGISTVMFLTNGIYISKKLFDTLKKHKENLYVQIDLHSLNEVYYDWFTVSEGNLEVVKKNIDLLISSGIKVRICSIFTPGNINEVYRIGEWAYKHGAVAYAPSVVVNIGRAEDSNGLLFQNIEQLYEFKKMQKVLSTKYPGFVQDIAEIEGMTRKNCGAIRSELSIDTFGNIKLCNMDSGENFKINMGNILQSSVKEIFDKNKDFLDAFIDVRLPDLTQKSCSDCTERAFCHNCLLRGFLSAKRLHKEHKECDWYSALPDVIKTRFSLT
jgi:radical SAM protein with 4Fe4S-binding SPASM domain